MTNTKGVRSPHYGPNDRRRVLMFVRDNPGNNGEQLAELWRAVVMGRSEWFVRCLHQCNAEGLVAYVPADGTEPTGQILPADPHVWTVTDTGHEEIRRDG